MNNYLYEHIYCINLERRKDRLETVTKEFKKHNLKVEIFKAIDGKKLNITTNINRGHAGCVLSHYNIIKDAKKHKYKSVMIFEDDAEFDNNFNDKLYEFTKQLPNDWDMLYLGGNHNGLHTLTQISENISKVSKTYTTHAYIIKNTMFDEIIEIFPTLSAEVDVMYSELQKKYNCYVIRPHLVWQKDGYSDIGEQYSKYDFLKK